MHAIARVAGLHGRCDQSADRDQCHDRPQPYPLSQSQQPEALGGHAAPACHSLITETDEGEASFGEHRAAEHDARARQQGRRQMRHQVAAR